MASNTKDTSNPRTDNTEQQTTPTNRPDVDNRSTANEQTKNTTLTKGKMVPSQSDHRDKETISRNTAYTETQNTPTNSLDVNYRNANGYTDNRTDTMNNENTESEQFSRFSEKVTNEPSARGAMNTAVTNNFSFDDLDFESGDVVDLDTDRQTEFSETHTQNTTRQINSPYYDSEGVCQYNPIPPTSTGIGSIQRMLKLCVDTKQQNSTTPATPPPYYQLPLSEQQAHMNF